MANSNSVTEMWYDTAYKNQGFHAQRLYPNEELLRFMGRNYFFLDFDKRKEIKILEVGCGSCSNLWMIAKEGFNAFGLDLSESSLELGRIMLNRWGVNAELIKGNMINLPFQDSALDSVVDVFSSYCLSRIDFTAFLNEVYRTLKTNGKLLLYTPSIHSDAFINHYPSKLLDDYTLNGIYRENSPFFGNFYPFRFESRETLIEIVSLIGFEINYLETTERSYNDGKEKFQHIILECTKS